MVRDVGLDAGFGGRAGGVSAAAASKGLVPASTGTCMGMKMKERGVTVVASAYLRFRAGGTSRLGGKRVGRGGTT